MALMQPGDTFIGLEPRHRRAPDARLEAQHVGKWFKAVTYTVRRQDHRIDFD